MVYEYIESALIVPRTGCDSDHIETKKRSSTLRDCLRVRPRNTKPENNDHVWWSTGLVVCVTRRMTGFAF